MGTDLAARQAREAADGVVREYEGNRDTIAGCIVQSQYLMAGIKNFNIQSWNCSYPSSNPKVEDVPSSSSRPSTHRTSTFRDEHPAAGHTGSLPIRRNLHRSMTMADPHQLDSINPSTSLPSQSIHAMQEKVEEEDKFSILRLDVSMGASRQGGNLMKHMEGQSVSILINHRIDGALTHLDQLLKRVHDPHSRVLITGDVNAGKSTLSNALLRRGDDIMPTDEQPLTTRFVEVVSARENEGREEIHILDQSRKYDPTDKTSFTPETIDKLADMVTDPDTDASSPPLRVFLKEPPADMPNPSILHNNVVDISLIDAPGLNRDSIKTTANFARQEEIDVVVFVVSAANHFTLSAKEFIWQAGHEKAHLFIVINRFDEVKYKARCEKAVLDQIRQLSPQTYQDRSDLVHFVDSAKVAMSFMDGEAGEDIDDAFSHLEHSLRSFVLVNRSKSKLGPALTYISRLMADVDLLSSANELVAGRERDSAKSELAKVKPELEALKKGRGALEENLIGEEERVTDMAVAQTKKDMEDALERIGRGELAVNHQGINMPLWTGVLGVWDYAVETKKALLLSLEHAVSLTEEAARRFTTEGVTHIDEIAEQSLPADIERPKRQFKPERMFMARSSTGISTVGLGLTRQSPLTEINLSDIFDYKHHIFLASTQLPSNNTPSPSQALIPYSAELSGFGAISALGAFSMVGGKAVGLKSALDAFSRFTEIASTPSARKWFGPIVGLVAVAGVAYVITELPRSIPRNVGRHLQATLLVSSGIGSEADLIPFTEAISLRVSREVRKVLRIAGTEVKDRYAKGLDGRQEVVRARERDEKRAIKAIEFFKETRERVEEIREKVGGVKL